MKAEWFDDPDMEEDIWYESFGFRQGGRLLRGAEATAAREADKQRRADATKQMQWLLSAIATTVGGLILVALLSANNWWCPWEIAGLACLWCWDEAAVTERLRT